MDRTRRAVLCLRELDCLAIKMHLGPGAGVLLADVLLSLARTLALPSIGQANLNPSRYAAISFPVPPRLEQLEIAEYIAHKLVSIRETERAVKTSVKQLEEYRSALVIAAVTGQIEGLQ